jgi:hypothetical protein
VDFLDDIWITSIHMARIVLAIVDLLHKVCKPMILKLFLKALEEDYTVGLDPFLRNLSIERSFACRVSGNRFRRLGEPFWISTFHPIFLQEL